MVKLSVIGTRNCTDITLINKELAKEQPDVMVVGGKMGPDQIAEEFAIDHEISLQVILPDYTLHGKSANYMRNLEMINQSTRILIFWDQSSRSPFNYLPYLKADNKSFRTILF